MSNNITSYELWQLKFAKRIEIDHEFDESVPSSVVWKEASRRVEDELTQTK